MVAVRTARKQEVPKEMVMKPVVVDKSNELWKTRCLDFTGRMAGARSWQVRERKARP